MNTSHSEGCREGMLFLLLTVTVLLLLLYIRDTVPKITKIQGMAQTQKTGEYRILGFTYWSE